MHAFPTLPILTAAAPSAWLLAVIMGWSLAGPCAAMEPGLWQFDIARKGTALGVVPLNTNKTLRVCVTGSALDEVAGLAARNSCTLRRRTAENVTTTLDGECLQAGMSVPITIHITEPSKRQVEVWLATRQNPWVRLTDHTVGRWISSACPGTEYPEG